MKFYCKYCPMTVRTPRSSCWTEKGVCPACDTDDKVPTQTELIDVMNDYANRNPVDMYWHHLTLREIQLNDNR